VRPVDDSLRNDTLLETIISLGRKLDMTMLAEALKPSHSSVGFAGWMRVGQVILFASRAKSRSRAMVGQIFAS